MELVKAIDWQAILANAAGVCECASVRVCERKFNIALEIDTDVLKEVAIQLSMSLEALNMNTQPNVAKLAGHVAFWIRKLKLITHSADTQNKLLTINEVVSIMVGMGVCRLMKDWSMSLRTHSHSPHNCAIAFEFLASER